MSEKLVCDQKIGLVLAGDFGLICKQIPRRTMQFAGTASQVCLGSRISLYIKFCNQAAPGRWIPKVLQPMCQF